MLNLNPPEALRQTGGRTTGRGGGGGGGGPGRGFKGMNDIRLVTNYCLRYHNLFLEKKMAQK